MQTIPKIEVNEWDMLFETIESGLDMPVNLHSPPVLDEFRVKNKIVFSDDAFVFARYEPENNTCKNCGQDMLVNSDMMICKNCGMEVKNDTAVGVEEHTSAKTNNVNSNGYLSVKIVGKGNYVHQKNMYKTSSSYPQKSRIDILREMKRYNDNSDMIKFPLDILQQTCEMFSAIKKSGMIFRKDGKRGVLAACIYYSAYAAGITKTPIEIANFIGINEKFYIQGDRIVQELSERGFITISQKINPTNDYVERYMTLLGIISDKAVEERSADEKRYKEFVIDIIARAEKYKLHIINDSKPNTKAIGVIYLLTLREKNLRHVRAAQIESTCAISRNTYMKYYELIIQHYKLFKKSFKKYRILMPKGWK